MCLSLIICHFQITWGSRHRFFQLSKTSKHVIVLHSQGNPLHDVGVKGRGGHRQRPQACLASPPVEVVPILGSLAPLLPPPPTVWGSYISPTTTPLSIIGDMFVENHYIFPSKIFFLSFTFYSLHFEIKEFFFFHLTISIDSTFLEATAVPVLLGVEKILIDVSPLPSRCLHNHN